MEVLIDLSNVHIFMKDFEEIKKKLDIVSIDLFKINDDLEKSPQDRSLKIKRQNLEDSQWDLLIDATCVYQDLTMFFERYESDETDSFTFKRLEKTFYNMPYIDATFSFVVPQELPPEDGV